MCAVILTQVRAGDVQLTQLVFPISIEGDKIYMGLRQEGNFLVPDLNDVRVDELSREAVLRRYRATQIEPVYHIETVGLENGKKETIDCYVVLTGGQLSNYVYLEVGNARAFYPDHGRDDVFIPIKDDLFNLVYTAQFLVHNYKNYSSRCSDYDDNKFNESLRKIGPKEQVSGRVTLRPQIVLPMLTTAAKRQATHDALNSCILF